MLTDMCLVIMQCLGWSVENFLTCLKFLKSSFSYWTSLHLFKLQNNAKQTLITKGPLYGNSSLISATVVKKTFRLRDCFFKLISSCVYILQTECSDAAKRTKKTSQKFTSLGVNMDCNFGLFPVILVILWVHGAQQGTEISFLCLALFHILFRHQADLSSIFSHRYIVFLFVAAPTCMYFFWCHHLRLFKCIQLWKTGRSEEWEMAPEEWEDQKCERLLQETWAASSISLPSSNPLYLLNRPWAHPNWKWHCDELLHRGCDVCVQVCVRWI